MSTSDEALLQYVGHIVPQSFQRGIIVTSYIVSCVGAVLTLELLNRRTSRNGLANHLILISAAIAMGGISIWCMHFIGNRAIVLAHDEPELRIDYSSGFSALSFFAPVIVLLVTFIAIGASYKVSWWRICFGGILAGTSICGMHYLGNLSIKNYNCVYNAVYVTGAAIIAIFDSTVALTLFFVFRASWGNTWWKRTLSACVLAGAVSGMHWVAAVGTQYRLIHLNDRNEISHSQDLKVAACLSILAVFFIIGFLIYESWLTRRRANKAQQIVLGVAVFDKSGRILVSPDGLLPSEKITDTYVERTQGDIFSISHPLFHWMFQVSRNWNSVNGMIEGMVGHLAHLPKGSRDSKIRLISDDGQPIENYDAIFRELFCVAAANLADKLREQLTDVGILWDDILATGTNQLPQKLDQNVVDCTLEEGTYGQFSGGRENGIMRQHEYGRGSLMFLVRRLEYDHDVNRLEAAGFRFAEIHQVCGIIGSRMQIKTRDLKGKLTNMATFAEGSAVMRPGVHLGFFGVKARVGSFGFDIVVKKGTRNLLPTMPIPIERLEAWQMEIIRHFDRMNVRAIFQLLDELKKLSPREVLFSSQIYDALQALRAWIDDPIVDDAVMTSKVVQVPCQAQTGSSSAKFCTMIALCIMMPIHVSTSSPRCEFIPLNFFKVHQMAYKDSPHLAAFARYVHRELSPIANSAPIIPPGAMYQQAGRAIFSRNRLNILHRFGKPNINNYDVMDNNYPDQAQSGRRSSCHDSDHAGSMIKLCNQDSQYRERLGSDAMSDKTGTYQSSLAGLGGIMVSQEIQVDISQIEDSGRKLSIPSKAVTSTDRVTMVKAGAGFDFEMDVLPGIEDARTGIPFGSVVAEREKVNEVITFVDELFAVCVDGL
ncbi:hypothetical protein F4805DRAFT_311045 [Annulohypoxylon moriforme]|nr:hypothetical protein F4805DRAFT_311045 [Annulohypoxylon moriforme]